jgi:hypothetical protein
MVVESVIGSRFKGRVVNSTTFGPYPAIIPEVERSVHITGNTHFILIQTDYLHFEILNVSSISKYYELFVLVHWVETPKEFQTLAP